MVKKKTQVSHCITRVTSTQVGWKKNTIFLLNLSYLTLIKSFICLSRIELKYLIIDVCEEKDTRLPGWVSAHGEQSDERETSSGNCQHFQVLPPGLYPFGKIRPKFTNIVLVKNTLKIPYLKIAQQGGNLEVGNLDIQSRYTKSAHPNYFILFVLKAYLSSVSPPQNRFPRVFDL